MFHEVNSRLDMAASIKTCTSCGKQMLSKVVNCPKCGEVSAVPPSRVKIIIGVILAALVIVLVSIYMNKLSVERKTRLEKEIAADKAFSKRMDDLQKSSASADKHFNEMRLQLHDENVAGTVALYNSDKQRGDQKAMCLQAEMVSVAYLQAQNQDEYRRWKSIEAEDCKGIR